MLSNHGLLILCIIGDDSGNIAVAAASRLVSSLFRLQLCVTLLLSCVLPSIYFWGV